VLVGSSRNRGAFLVMYPEPTRTRIGSDADKTRGDACRLASDGLQLVRSATQRMHASLESVSTLSALVSAKATHGDYRVAISVLAGLYLELDRVMAAWHTHHSGHVSPYRPRGECLTSESVSLGVEPAAVWRLRIPERLGVGGYLGARYVVDGAQFGNATIAKALSSSGLAWVLHRESSFWNTRFVTRGEWRALCRRLQGLEDRGQLAGAARGARAVFGYFHRHLSVR